MARSFQSTAADNALPAYWSASEYFKNGDTAAAVKELEVASRLPEFNDYLLDNWTAVEQAQREAGIGAGEATATAAMTLILPHLPKLKAVGEGVAALMSDYYASGAVDSAHGVGAAGTRLAEHLQRGEGSMTLLSQLVGVAIEQTILKAVPTGADAPFINLPISERLQNLAAFRKSTSPLVQRYEQMLDSGDEERIRRFFEQMREVGEYRSLEQLSRE